MASALPASSRTARAFWSADCRATTAGEGVREVSAARRVLAMAAADVSSASSRSASLRTAAFWLAASLAAFCARSRLSSAWLRASR